MSALAARRVPAADSDVDRVAMPGRGDRTDDVTGAQLPRAHARRRSRTRPLPGLICFVLLASPRHRGDLCY